MRGGEAIQDAVLRSTLPEGAQDAPALVIDANIPPATAHAHHLAFPDSREGAYSFAFAPDRDSIYVEYDTAVVDVWAMAVYYWPELLGGVAAMVTVAALLVALRIRRRPQARSAAYCRNCNYDVTSLVGPEGTGGGFERCPECGVSLTRRPPIRGRGKLRRAAPVALLVALAAGGLAWLHIAGVPREGSLSRLFSLPSQQLAAWIKANAPSLNTHAKWGTAVAEVGLSDEPAERLLHVRRGGGWVPIAASPDGRVVLSGARALSDMRLIDTRSRAWRDFPRPSSLATLVDFMWCTPVEFSQDGRSAYVSWVSTVSSTLGIARLNIESGAVEQVFTTPRGELESSRASRRLFALRSEDPLTFVSMEEERRYVDGHSKPELILRLHDAEIERPLTLSGPHAEGISRGHIPRGGSRLLAAHSMRPVVATFDLHTGEERASLQLPGQMGVTAIQTSIDNRFLFLAQPYRVLVRDQREHRWVASLHLPDRYMHSIQISPNNRWVAAMVLAGSGRMRRELYLWNLGEILEQTEHAQPIESQSP